jgi:lactate dehydrogenase-like 2-hydroxyacid dehydrogenase
MSKPALLQTGPMMPLIETQLATVFDVHKVAKPADLEAVLTKCAATVEAVCTGGHTGVKTDASLIARLPKLKVIGNFGVGYDSIDVPAAAKRGVIITNTPDVLTEEVADTALGLMLMTVREFGQAEQYLRAGKWAQEGDYRLTPHSLRDRTLGMVGYGRIGKAIAMRAAAFGMPITYFGRKKQADVQYPFYSDLVAMARDVDTLMIITPGGPETKGLVGKAVLEALGPRGIVINVARGSVVDEAALMDALHKGTIWGAGLDVMYNEPKIDPALMALPNTVLLPHVGSASVHTRNGMGQLVTDNLLAYAAKKVPLTPVAETPFKAW